MPGMIKVYEHKRPSLSAQNLDLINMEPIDPISVAANSLDAGRCAVQALQARKIPALTCRSMTSHGVVFAPQWMLRNLLGRNLGRLPVRIKSFHPCHRIEVW
jgi:hypothetical protein